MAEADDSLPRLLGGRYRLDAKLGSGGMGVVYRAADLTMKRSVAVKLIRGVDGVAIDEEVAGRFLREAKNTARVQHENIIEVYDFGRSDTGDMFFVMELLEGESLSARLRRETKLAPKVAVHIVRQMCAALHVAHAAGIVHRDLKPANVMLIERAGDKDYAKVLDFGVAKSTAPDQETQLTHTGMLVGTVEYMAPEQIMGRQVDARTDIYALGVVMYRMFSGKAPFRDGGVPALIHAHLNVMPKPITEISPEVPGAVDRIVLRCMAKRPEQRFESMEEVSRALASALQPEDLSHLVSLEYNAEDADPYGSGDETEIARPSGRGSGRSEVAVPPDDATVRLDRPEPLAPPSRPRQPLAPDDGTAVMFREEVSTAKRPVPDEIMRIERQGPRECAMCRTMNAPHARACSACGVSLAAEEQNAVRARVTAPRTAHLSAPQSPPPISGSYPSPGAPPYAQSPPRGVDTVPPGRHVAPGGYPSAWGSVPPSTPPTMWQRFLSWTGLKGR